MHNGNSKSKGLNGIELRPILEFLTKTACRVWCGNIPNF